MNDKALPTPQPTPEEAARDAAEAGDHAATSIQPKVDREDGSFDRMCAEKIRNLHSDPSTKWNMNTGPIIINLREAPVPREQPRPETFMRQFHESSERTGFQNNRQGTFVVPDCVNTVLASEEAGIDIQSTPQQAEDDRAQLEAFMVACLKWGLQRKQ